MSLSDEPWNEKFKEMMKYKETHGHLTFAKKTFLTNNWVDGSGNSENTKRGEK
jgi:hypothetical protein